jgi:hypothetical protein
MTKPAKALTQQDIELYEEFKSMARIDSDLRRKGSTPPEMDTSREEVSPFIPANRS